MDNQYINIKGCKENNLKNIDLKIPRNQFVVITGPSGSGKSSLAFDTLYKEGQRRYVESINTYGQQYLEQYQPPEVDLLEGLSPTIAIRSKRHTTNPRSTVATSSSIYDLFRILFSNFGTLKDPETGEIIKSFTTSEVARAVLKHDLKTKVQILAPVIYHSESKIENIILKYEKLGFNRVLYQGEVKTFSEIDFNSINLDELKIIIDRIVIKEDVYRRLIDSIELAYKIGNGTLNILCDDHEYVFCENNINPHTGKVFPKLTPQFFSYNRSEGACPKCSGIGYLKEYKVDNLIFDESLTIADGAIYLINKEYPYIFNFSVDYLTKNKLQDIPLKDFTKNQREEFLFGSHKKDNYKFIVKNKTYELDNTVFPGIINWLNNNLEDSYLKTEVVCDLCGGGKLNKIALSTYFFDKNIHDICKMNIKDCYNFFINCKFDEDTNEIIQTLYYQIVYKLELLLSIGLEYLNLDRKTSTLSGGEHQRLNIATQLGSKLSGVLYILDEPTIGIHSSETDKLIENINTLKKNGNSIIVVEHDNDLIQKSDHIIELGPKSGINGGEVIYSGQTKDFLNHSTSLTASYIKDNQMALKDNPRKENNSISFKDIVANNLKGINIDFPLQTLTTVTGISGSGKSSLIHHVLAETCRHYINNKSTPRVTNYNSVTGLEQIKTLVEITAKPIGKSPNSIPATYLDIYKYIRELFAATNDSKIRGYTAKRFSFNVKGGRCEHCEGKGKIKVDMHFLADVWVTCNICNGSRFNIDTLSILYKGKSIADVLDMSAEEALSFFENHPKLSTTLKLLCSLDLSYIKLGQSSVQLSGGESQRLKITKELSKRTNGHTLYLLDEPTSGLHSNEIHYLLAALNNLVDEGNTVILIEHNLEVISQSDYIIDLGPEAGPRGGEIVYKGNPVDIIACERSKTGQELKKHLDL